MYKIVVMFSLCFPYLGFIGFCIDLFNSDRSFLCYLFGKTEAPKICDSQTSNEWRGERFTV